MSNIKINNHINKLVKLGLLIKEKRERRRFLSVPDNILDTLNMLDEDLTKSKVRLNEKLIETLPKVNSDLTKSKVRLNEKLSNNTIYKTNYNTRDYTKEPPIVPQVESSTGKAPEIFSVDLKELVSLPYSKVKEFSNMIDTVPYWWVDEAGRDKTFSTLKELGILDYLNNGRSPKSWKIICQYYPDSLSKLNNLPRLEQKECMDRYNQYYNLLAPMYQSLIKKEKLINAGAVVLPSSLSEIHNLLYGKN